VFLQPENVQVVFGRIAPDAFKNGGAVVQGMCIDWNFGLVPFYKLAVKPDKLAALYLHVQSQVLCRLIKILNQSKVNQDNRKILV
jgi:hypothetical protein